MYHLSLSVLRAGLDNKAFSSVELTQHFLNRIHRHDNQLNSFITVTDDMALAQAAEADALIASGNQGPLTGIPMAHKDILCTRDVLTSCGSKMLANFISPYDATVVRQCREQGLVMLGKTNMDEFAMGSTNETSYYGPCHNPWRHDYSPGGSSGGSAAAVAARLTPIATGSDTGGSIRQPAAMCGITGLKPTYGLVSRFGMIAFASSLDQCGPFGRSADDCAFLLNALVGHDPNDSTSLQRPKLDYTQKLKRPLKGLKVGVIAECLHHDGLDTGVKHCIQAAMGLLEREGVELIEIAMPHLHLSLPCYYIIAPAEASSNLARYDGVRFGHRCDDPKDLNDLYFRSRTEGFGAEVKRRILAGTYVLSSGLYDDYYLKAQKIRQLIKQDYIDAFEQVDVLLNPTTPKPSVPLGSQSEDHISMYLSDVFTIGANLAGLPGISLPVGFVDDLPVGMQLTANYFDEETLLQVGHQYQQLTDWHMKMPANFDDEQGEKS